MKNTAFCLLLSLMGMHLITAPLQAAPLQARHVTVELLAEDKAVVPGQSLWVLLQFTPEKDWHTYWKNPGDSGLAPTLEWALPAGWTAQPPRFPTPEAIPYGRQMNYGYHGPNGLLVELVPPAKVATANVDLQLNARWLVCADACVPGQGEFQLALPVAARREADATQAELYAKARESLPIALPAEGTFKVTEEHIHVELPAETLPDGELQVFIAPAQIAEPGANAEVKRQGNRLQIKLVRHTYFSGAPEQLEVVLTQSSRGWSVPARHITNP